MSKETQSESDFLKKIKYEFDTAEFGENISVNLKSMSFTLHERIQELEKENAGSDTRISETKSRIKVQDILQKNMRTPIGMFHGKELNERGFISSLFKNFTLIQNK